MNVKHLFMMTAVVAAMSTAAMAAEGTAPAVAPAPAATAAPTGQFELQKAQTLKSIGERIADMQKKQSCVQAAATPEAVKACFPNMPHPGMMPPGVSGEHKPDSDMKPAH